MLSCWFSDGSLLRHGRLLSVSSCPLSRLLVAKNTSWLSRFKLWLSFSTYKVVHIQKLYWQNLRLHILGAHLFMFGRLRICSYKHSVFKSKNIIQKPKEFLFPQIHASLKMNARDFPRGAVVKNPPAKAGDTGSIPGLGRSHMPWSN